MLSRTVLKHSYPVTSPSKGVNNDPLTQAPLHERIGYDKASWMGLTKDQRIQATATYYRQIELQEQEVLDAWEVQAARESLEAKWDTVEVDTVEVEPELPYEVTTQTVFTTHNSSPDYLVYVRHTDRAGNWKSTSIGCVKSDENGTSPAYYRRGLWHLPKGKRTGFNTAVMAVYAAWEPTEDAKKIRSYQEF